MTDTKRLNDVRDVLSVKSKRTLPRQLLPFLNQFLYRDPKAVFF